MRRRVVLFLLPLLALGGGCVTQYTEVAPQAALGAGRAIHVVRYQDDPLGVDKLIARTLEARGYRVSAGNDRTAQSGTDFVVTYISRSSTPVRLRSLAIFFTTPRANARIATGYQKDDSLTGKPAQAMVDEVLTSIFSTPPGTTTRDG